MSKKLFFSIIVPIKRIGSEITDELIPSLKKQSYKNFELILVPDKEPKIINLPDFARIIPSWPKTGPADKRDLAAENSRGDILAFIDSDAYPDKYWLEKASIHFENTYISGVCGPGITPGSDSMRQKVSGFVWSSWIGAGGAGTYRNRPEKERFVDDYPTCNLIIRKKDFMQVGGFNSDYWPGEDTKLCLDIVYGLKKKIIYDPDVLVYHHRRPVFMSHLAQIGRYGLHRGHFVKKYPRTSRRIRYFTPSLFLLGLILAPLLIYILNLLGVSTLLIGSLYVLMMSVYLLALVLTSLQVSLLSRNVLIGLFFIPAVISSHLFYGVMFLKGLFAKELK